MAELPEIYQLSTQMNDSLSGKQIERVEIKQEKCCNVSGLVFSSRVIGSTVKAVQNKGKGIIVSLSNGENMLISLGMGGDLLYFEPISSNPVQEKYQFLIQFQDGTGFSIRFWWFGKVYIANDQEIKEEKIIKAIAFTPFDKEFTYDYFRQLVNGKKAGIKSFLLNQKNVGGIGNMYIHDILFESGIHPQKKVSDLSEEEVKNLYNNMHKQLHHSLSKGSFSLEKEFYGHNGEYLTSDFQIAYKKGEPCPRCGETIQSIKTGSTTSYICPACQRFSKTE
ncbi:DNA-formamidopyrimidine glycosylase family protein [Bacillus sp. E214]|uniref:DNA-formamidopyrimidine glycosylase family protein n=1 Tax=Bacillus sp. E214 TaxID=2587156 RepID=UPI0011DFB025|nr:DNA-formamidopyrimidine glycosylase family protein [Bacillus sp. E214]